jgi:hypothetical protein
MFTLQLILADGVTIKLGGNMATPDGRSVSWPQT